jgi:hypothetical protein
MLQPSEWYAIVYKFMLARRSLGGLFGECKEIGEEERPSFSQRNG